MSKKIYCIIIEDDIKAEIVAGNYALAAVCLNAAVSMDIGEGDIDMITRGDPDTTVEVSSIIFDACKKDILDRVR